MRFLEEFSKEKLNEEDRMVVFSYCSNSAMFNSSQKLSSHALLSSKRNELLAIGAIVLSFTSIISSFLQECKFIILLLGLAIFLILFTKYIFIGKDLEIANKKVDKIIDNNVRDANEIARYHFNYAKK